MTFEMMANLHFLMLKSVIALSTLLVNSHLDDNQRVIFETSGLHISDVIIAFNRLLGNPEFGKAGIKPRE